MGCLKHALMNSFAFEQHHRERAILRLWGKCAWRSLLLTASVHLSPKLACAGAWKHEIAQRWCGKIVFAPRSKIHGKFPAESLRDYTTQLKTTPFTTRFLIPVLSRASTVRPSSTMVGRPLIPKDWKLRIGSQNSAPGTSGQGASSLRPHSKRRLLPLLFQHLRHRSVFLRSGSEPNC